MSTRNNDVPNGLSITRIETSDTISDFVEKCNNNFANLLKYGGGTVGAQGKTGDQGVPTKPKVPIHVWKKGDNYEFQYRDEKESNGEYYITEYFEDLTDVKYQEGHLIILENAHVYILKTESGILKPTFLLALQSYDPKTVINGKTAYVHIAYADNMENFNGFITDEELRLKNSETEPATYNLRRNTSTYNNINVSEKPYMGIYSDNNQSSSIIPTTYTWIRMQGYIGLTGPQGEQGPKGDKGDTGDPGDGYTGQQYSVDLDGDISTISLNENRTCLYSTENDYCECIIHAYYGAENKKISLYNITIGAPNGYIKDSDNNIIKSDGSNTIAGQITLSENGNDISIKFTPDYTFIFPETPIIFPIHIKSEIHDDNDGKTYIFNRDTIWTIKGVVSNFELEIIPQYRTIKLFEDGKYFPQKLLASVYKTVGGERTLFNFKDSPFTFLYKYNDSDEWTIYQNEGIPTTDSSCIEFKVVKNYGSTSPETPEEIWDYEDVWVVADGKSTHYYHADLGNVESMVVFTTGVEKIIETKNGPQKCAELRNESGYSITFNPKFYDGTNEIKVTDIGIGSNSGEEYYQNGEGSFMYKLKDNTLTITRVPFDVEMIPMTIVVNAEEGSNSIKSDSITFNIYISTINNIYTLSPSTTVYNTSTGKTGDTIGCDVYKNNVLIKTSDLDENGLELKYAVYSGGSDTKDPVKYTEPLVYGDDSDIAEDEFAASDVAIVFILYYNNEEIARSTVPLTKDGIDGVDGDGWQYIFCRSNKYPFIETGISNPSKWYIESDKSHINPYEEYIPEEYKDIWFDDHQGVDKNNKYEYQSYRKWDKINKCWGTYGEPTLYSNYSEDGKNGSGYNVILSNPVSVIPVGHDDWSVNENSDNQKDYTFIYLYNNTTDITSEIDGTGKNKVSISLPEDNIYVQKGNFTVDNNAHKVSFIPVVGEGDNKSIFDFQSNTQYKLPITLTYNLGNDIDGDGMSDIFTTTINWTLTPIRGLEDFEVFVDKHVVNTSTADIHELKVGYYSISSSGGKRFIGNNDEENVYGYDIILTSDIKSITSTSPVVSNWQSADYNFVKNGENRNCYVVLTKINNESVDIIDYVNVTAINDGKSAIHLELSQDYIELPSLNGYIHPTYNDNMHPISSRMLLYNGDKLIEDYDKIIYSFKINGELVDENEIFVENNKDTHGRFTIPKELINGNGNGNTNIECIATYNGASYYKTLYICLEERPFELLLNKNILTRDVNINRIIDKELSVRVKYWDFNQGNWVDTRDGEVKINSINGKENLPFELVNDGYDRKITIENSIIATNDKDTEFRISYYINGEELTYETIGVITNGKNGTAPSCSKVEILGYSLNENEDIDNGTWVSLSELGDLQTGQPIYILSKYTWSDETETKVKSVTLSGAQGVEGKSRVLFYLGSFQDGTLNGEQIIGKLDSDRCDYYIDEGGEAWMRIGSEGDVVGYKSGYSNNSTNWKKSTKVGFLQTGAIHADMINTGSITADSALVTTLFAQDITADNLKVKAANIDGQLTADQIATGVIPEGLNRDDVTQIIGETEIDGGKIRSDSITAAQIKSGTITADKIATHSITADQIATGVIPEDLNIDWLKTAFNDGSTIISNGLVLSSLIGVSGDNGIESGLNSSNTIKSGRDDYNDKKLVFFAGSNGLKTMAGGSANVTSNSSKGYTSDAKIEFFADGSGYVAGDKFKWDKFGKGTVKNFTIENSILNGSVRSPFKHIDTSWDWDDWDEFEKDLEQADPDAQDIYDNLYCSVGMYAIPWTWTNDNIGRHVTLIHNRGGNQVTNYSANTISAPDGYYFFEDGVARKELDFSNEMFDLIGYGNEEGNFHGWIVNKRDNIMTSKKYGHNLKCLCFGTVYFTTEGTSNISILQTFDGTSTSTSYHISQRFSITSDTSSKSCTITMPECWFRGNAQSNLHVELTPVLYDTSSKIPQIALGTITNNSFTVYTDKYPAKFNFMLYNKGDWSSFCNKFAYDKIVYVENTKTSYRTLYLSSNSSDTSTMSGFTTNASNGLTAVYVDGDISWVSFSISGGTLTATTKSANPTVDARYATIRIKPKSLSSNEIETESVDHYINIILYQYGQSQSSGGDDRT